MLAVSLVAGALMLKERAAQLVRVAADNGVQAWPRAPAMALGNDGEATPGLVRAELITRELGRQPAVLCRYPGHANHRAPAVVAMPLSPGRSVLAAMASAPAALLLRMRTRTT